VCEWVCECVSVCVSDVNIQALGPTLRRDPVLVGAARQAAVVRVQTRHVTRAVAARRRTLALLLLPPGRVWRGRGTEHRNKMCVCVCVCVCGLKMKSRSTMVQGITREELVRDEEEAAL